MFFGNVNDGKLLFSTAFTQGVFHNFAVTLDFDQKLVNTSTCCAVPSCLTLLSIPDTLHTLTLITVLHKSSTLLALMPWQM